MADADADAAVPLLLLAQAAPDPVSGGAGFAAAGLLGSILAWLLFVHLPAKDKLITSFVGEKDRQIADMLKRFDDVITKKDDQIDDQRREFTACVSALAAAFRAEAEAERNSCEKHFASLADAIGQQSQTHNQMFRTLGEQLAAHSERNRQWTEILAKTVKDAQDAAARAAAPR